jgi:hypothetical protein
MFHTFSRMRSMVIEFEKRVGRDGIEVLPFWAASSRHLPLSLQPCYLGLLGKSFSL